MRPVGGAGKKEEPFLQDFGQSNWEFAVVTELGRVQAAPLEGEGQEA